MKNILFLFGLCGLLVINAARVDAVGGGTLPDADNPFWQVMAQLDRPDDATCEAKTTAIFDANSIPTDVATIQAMCASITQMMQMADDINASGVDTNLFDKTDWHHITGLYFSSQYGKVEFTNEIDFMSRDFMVFLQTFIDRFEGGVGEIGLDADIVNGLRNSGAVITMYNVPEFDEVEILVNGGVDKGDVVSDITYDPGRDEITFNAAHFTTFKAVEKGVTVSNKRAKIYGVTAQKIFTLGGKERIMLTIRGDDFDKDSDVKLGSRKAYKIKYKSKKKLIAYFRPNDLKNVSDPAYVKVINEYTPSKKFKQKIRWQNLPLIKEIKLLK